MTIQFQNQIIIKNCLVIHLLIELQHFYPSGIVNYLVLRKGIQMIASEIAQKGLPIAGRLQYFNRNWEVISQDQWVLDSIQNFRIPFRERPIQGKAPNPLSYTQTELTLLEEEIQNLLEKKAIEKIAWGQQQFVSNMFLVAKKDGGQRPVINLKPLNCYVNTEHFKMEGIHCLPNLLKSGDWMAKIDLKDAYFMIPIQEQDRAFLTFRFRDQLFQFRCLPFGLSCAPWVFTKTLKPVVAQLRQLGIRLVVYIDDILIMAESRELAQENVIGLVFLLENLGFVINRDKSILEPTQEIEFLGFNVNSVNTELSLPSKKIKQIRDNYATMFQQQPGNCLNCWDDCRQQQKRFPLLHYFTVSYRES